MRIEQIVSKYRFNMIHRRWLALWIDGMILLAFLAIPALSFSEDVYHNTVWLWCICMFSYLFVLEGLKGWTVGKLLMKIRVINAEGLPAGLFRSLIRNILRLIEANPILFGGSLAGIVALLSKKRQRLGDMLAKTYVVMRDDVNKIAPPEESPQAEPSFVNIVKSIQEPDVAT